jgi:hypothetical protein
MKKIILACIVASIICVSGMAQEAPESAALPASPTPFKPLSVGLLIDNYTNFLENDGTTTTASQKMHTAFTFTLSTQNFGTTIGFTPSNWFLQNGYGASNDDGSEYDTAALSAVDSYFAWAGFFDNKLKFYAGQMDMDKVSPSDQFHMYAYTIRGPTAVTYHKFISATVPGAAIITAPSPQWSFGLFVPMNYGVDDFTEAYKRTSVAAKYTKEGIGYLSFQYGNAKYTDTDTTPYIDLSLIARCIAVQDLDMYLSYEYIDKLITSSKIADNWNNIEFGAQYTGIDKLLLAFDAEVDVFTATSTTESYIGKSAGDLAVTGGVNLQAKYNLISRIAAGCNLTYAYGVDETNLFVGPPFFAGANGVKVAPFLKIEAPAGPPPFVEMTLSFEYTKPTDGSNPTWCVPLWFRFLCI